MRLLLDTHALLWWVFGDPKLSPGARRAITQPDNEIVVSAASAWEIATKYRIGKMPEAKVLATDIAGALTRENFGTLSVSLAHGQHAGALPGQLKDPFDRMLIAQSLLERLPLVSNEKAFDAYGVKRVW